MEKVRSHPRVWVKEYQEDFIIMKVNLHLFGTLKSYLPLGERGRSCFLDLPEGYDVRQVLKELGISDETPKIVIINHERKSVDVTLKEGERLSILPPMVGG